jgi:hypothetical protein
MVWQPPQARLAQPLRVLEATPAWTIQSGQFTACVELEQPGRFPLRVLEQNPRRDVETLCARDPGLT